MQARVVLQVPKESQSPKARAKARARTNLPRGRVVAEETVAKRIKKAEAKAEAEDDSLATQAIRDSEAKEE